VDGEGHPVGSTRQAQFAAFDPEPVEDDEPADGEDEGDDGDEDDDEEDDEDSVDPPEDLPGDELSDVPLLEALSLALAALRLSVR
jgi:hypothetical protein